MQIRHNYMWRFVARTIALCQSIGRVLVLLFLVFFVCVFCASFALAVESKAGGKALPTREGAISAISVEECIKLALVESPYMQMHDLSIAIKGLDADDAWYRMFPKIDLYVSSNIPIGGDNTDDSSYTVSLRSSGYDPILASLSHDAQLKMIVLAKYAKLKSASDLLENVVSLYIRESAFQRGVGYYDQLIAKAEELYAYSAKMYPDAPTEPLELKLIKHRVKQIRLEKEKLINRHTRGLVTLKRMIGVPVEQRIELVDTDVDKIVFQGFNPNRLTFEEVRRNSLKEKIAKISEELAEHNILAAWARNIPKFTFNVRAPDPVNNDSDDESYYFTVGMTVPLWHWGELARGRDRARIKKRRTVVNNKAELFAWEDLWYLLRSQFQEQADAKGLANVEVEMCKLQVRKNEILFNSGTASYAQFTESEMAQLRKEIEATKAYEDLLMVKLKLFFESGQLLDRFVKVKDIENEAE